MRFSLLESAVNEVCNWNSKDRSVTATNRYKDIREVTILRSGRIEYAVNWTLWKCKRPKIWKERIFLRTLNIYIEREKVGFFLSKGGKLLLRNEAK